MDGMSTATLVGIGALGGAVYATVGFFKEKVNKGESFDINKFLQPVMYGTAAGAFGVIVAPELGWFTIGSVGEAFTAGGMGSAFLEKFISGSKDSIMDSLSKMLGKIL